MSFAAFILSAIGIVLVFEGLCYAFFPDKFKDYAYQISQLDDKNLRQIGGVMVLAGFTLMVIFKAWH